MCAVKIGVRYVYMYMYDLDCTLYTSFLFILHVYDPLCPTNVAN